MDSSWQDRINDELRSMRRSETRAQLSAENQGLQGGYLVQESLWAGAFPGRWVRCFHAMIRRIVVGPWRLQHASPRDAGAPTP